MSRTTATTCCFQPAETPHRYRAPDPIPRCDSRALPEAMTISRVGFGASPTGSTSPAQAHPATSRADLQLRQVDNVPERPRLSVVIPTHNRPDLARRLVRNLWRVDREELNLGRDGLEVIVVDDASTPPLDLGDNRCRTIHLDRNHGHSGACNAGAREARGRFIAFADDDTILLPGGWRALLSILEHDEAAWVGPQIIPPSSKPSHGSAVLTVEALSTAFIVTRRERFEAVGVFNESVKALADYDISLRARHGGDRLLMYTGAVLVHDDPRATFPAATVRFHHWISETPEIWARTGGSSEI